MNAIIGMTGIAIQEKQDSQKVEDCLHKIDSSSQYLLSLINDFGYVQDRKRKDEAGKWYFQHEAAAGGRI